MSGHELPTPLGPRYVELRAAHTELADSRARWRAAALFASGLALVAGILAAVGWLA